MFFRFFFFSNCFFCKKKKKKKNRKKNKKKYFLVKNNVKSLPKKTLMEKKNLYGGTRPWKVNILKNGVLLAELHQILYQSSDFYVVFQICHKVNLPSLQHVFHHQIHHYCIFFHCALIALAIFYYFFSKKHQCIVKLDYVPYLNVTVREKKSNQKFSKISQRLFIVQR